MIIDIRNERITSPLALGERVAKPQAQLDSEAEARRVDRERLALEEAAKAEEERQRLEHLAELHILESGSTDAKQALLRRRRCKAEQAKPAVHWPGIGMEQVMANHDKSSCGLIYGLPFPWSAVQLEVLGATWLTQAFQAAGTLEEDNAVTSVHVESAKIDSGNNAGKFLFTVTYAKPSAVLHTKLFAKVPFAMTPDTQADRLSSSVYKQPMDFMEINAYRLLEASFPVKTPKFYYGDISSATSNFILILERILYAELDGFQDYLQPGSIEGPFEKCRDHLLPRNPDDYYRLLLKKTAVIAAAHKRGDMGSEHFLRLNVLQPGPGPPSDKPEIAQKVLETAVKFFAESAYRLYPDYVTRADFRAKFMKTMLQFNAYAPDVERWKNGTNSGLLALGHQNLNLDNAYFWRDSHGNLDCGLLDWGGFGVSSLGHKIWWMFNTALFDSFKHNLQDYIELFASTYEHEGGVQVDRLILKQQILLTSLANTMYMAKAVPNCYKMLPQREWANIDHRDHPQIAGNIGGKSTLRTTVQVLENGLRCLEELQADQVLEEWISNIYVGQWMRKPKPEVVL